MWPPVGIETISPWGLPFIGTCLLLASGFFLTYCHHAIITGNKVTTIVSLFFTIVLGAIFMVIQVTEYFYAEYTFADSVFGNNFFGLTGLHGLHVLVGILF